MVINPAKALRGEIVLPGDKSISHRAAILSSIAAGESRIDNFATSADCRSTLGCLRELGVQIRVDGRTVWVTGVGKNGFSRPEGRLDCGNSGTTMRLMAGVLAGQSFDSVLVGDASLSRRPMRRVIEPLQKMGGDIVSDEGFAPLEIRGKSPLQSMEYELPIPSAQIKSCIMLAGLYANGKTVIIEPVLTRDHTERMVRWFGGTVEEEIIGEGKRISVSNRTELTASPVTVPGDISSAAFFLIAAACLNGSDLLLKDVGTNATRTGVLDVLGQVGASVKVTNLRVVNNEPIGDMSLAGALDQQNIDVIRGDTVAGLIDELPILAVLGTQLENGLEVRDALELRVKETDRIAAVVENLRRMKADVEEFDDGFRVGRSRLRGAQIDSFGDHRIAMAFAIAGLIAEEGETEIIGAECVEVSFPGFFDVLQDVVIYE